MQFSLRRMLLAVAVFAAILGTFSLYAKRFGMFRSDRDPTSWWVAVAAMAVAVSGILLVGHRRDLPRIVNACVWTSAGFIAAGMPSSSHWLDHAIFFLSGRIPGLLGDCILGGLLGWFIGCICSRWLYPLSPSTPPACAAHPRDG
jgi:hypothetical protein